MQDNTTGDYRLYISYIWQALWVAVAIQGRIVVRLF